MSRPGRAPGAAVPHRWAAVAAVAMSLCGSLLSGPAAESAEDKAQFRPDRVLFDTILSDLLEPGRVDLASLPPEVHPRADEFRRRAMAFRSLLPLAAREPGPELWASEKRQEMERGIVALVDAPGIEEMARDYAKRAVLMYEWEGMGEGPLAEAAFAEQFLHANPDTPMAPYLTLFLAHRYRCASEALEAEMKPEAATTTHATYLEWLDAAIQQSDPLVRYTAQDLSRRMRVYLPAPASPALPDCPDSALSVPIPDPRAWALRCFALSEGEEAGLPSSLAAFFADIDQDEVPELFIGSSVARGNAGGVHYVFASQGIAYRYLGSIFAHPSAFAVLPAAADGRPRVRRYVHLSAGEGLLETLTYDGRAFAIVSSERIAAPEADSNGMAKALGGVPVADAQPSPDVPALPRRKAVELAEAFVAQNAADVSGQQLSSVTLQVDRETGELYWLAQWSWTQPRLGGEYGLRVYMDGRMKEARLGP
jgi:hypothetical protein